MNAVTLLNALECHLSPLIEAEQGTVEICGTVEDTLSRLAQAPKRWRVILQWQREFAQGSTRTAVEMRFLVIVQQAKGLDVMPGADMHRDRAGDPSLLARMNQVRDWIRAVRFAHPEITGTGPELRDTTWLSDPRFPTRQVSIEFSLLYGLDAISPATIPL